ncbi:RNase III inhibitor [Myxococcus xanthus]|uniref:macro domain-containing protein n=1 Tax=Myxococcus xanthus TaxID=34 RepID=UPI00112E16BF|nr:macro domain-containing protein [Myxococcus xanthus]QDE88884.1 RNase III inhibitor [Myxococcus xanthus]
MSDERLVLMRGDITQVQADAIVNAANSTLLGGGGVDGAIHHAAGPGLLAECRPLGRCPPGEARITGGHALPARHVIHAVGPVWQGYGYPIERAARIALREILAALQRMPTLQRVTVVLFSDRDLDVYQRARQALEPTPSA